MGVHLDCLGGWALDQIITFTKFTLMKPEIHPEYKESTIQCSCGNVIQTRSTAPDLRVGICSACHPFFTGEQRFVDTAGRVDKFTKRYGSSKARRVAPKVSEAAEASA